MSRPVSAPTLLRGEGMLRQRTHEDYFLQGIENNSVTRVMDGLSRERFFLKDSIGQVDMLSDPSLHELLILHNRSQRSKGSEGRRRHPNHDPSKKAHADAFARTTPKKKKAIGGSHSESQLSKMLKPQTLSDQVRELCQKLDASIQHHCVSEGVPEELGLHKCPIRASMKNDVAENMRGLLRGSTVAQLSSHVHWEH